MIDRKSHFGSLGLGLLASVLGGLFFLSDSQASRFKHLDTCEAFLELPDHARFNRKFMDSRFEADRMAAFYQRNENFRKAYRDITGQDSFNFNVARNSIEPVRAAYHKHYFAQFEDLENLEKLRSASLIRSLEAHGYRTDPELSGRENLVRLSQQNRERILQNIQPQAGLRGYRSDPTIVDFIEKFKFKFLRNSHDRTVESRFIISSQRLADYGGTGGLNSQKNFNSEFIRQDDNIFFFVGWGRRDTRALKSAQAYGNSTKFVDVEYARQHGFISAFIMVPEQLVTYGENLQMADAQTIDDLDNDTNNHDDIHDWSKESTELASRIRDRLHEYDFTIDDYETILQSILGAALWQKSQEMTRPYFNAYMNKLNADHIFSYDQVNEMVYQPYNFNMEMKIPVALPETAVSID